MKGFVTPAYPDLWEAAKAFVADDDDDYDSDTRARQITCEEAQKYLVTLRASQHQVSSDSQPLQDRL